MCMPKAPKLPAPKPFVAPAALTPPPAAQATATSVKPAGEAAPVKRTRNRNPLRTDSGAVDSVATGLNIPS